MPGKINQKAVEETDFYFVHEGLTGRPPGVYMDVLERQQAEIQRAKVEGREPDLEFPPATAGTPLATLGDLERRGPAAQSEPHARTELNEDPEVFTLHVDNTTAVDASTPDLSQQKQLAAEDKVRAASKRTSSRKR